MILVILETPYAGDVAGNLAYLRACMRDCLQRGEAPFASHALYTQAGVLRDDVAAEREQGIHAGFAWRRVAPISASLGQAPPGVDMRDAPESPPGADTRSLSLRHP